jgi:excisionase family DNA binding protein
MIEDEIMLILKSIDAKLNRVTLKEKTFLNITEAAEYTGYKIPTLHQYHSDGKIKAFKPGGKSLRFRPSDLDDFMKTGESKTIDQILKSNGYKN